ncbi:MAG: spermidine/putrescine ABC transporter substrate-binding protein [Clostridia bacterium]|nr:spermidine/putrescine ABC transporter substrate-binding protein [Clostridia bacterium]
MKKIRVLVLAVVLVLMSCPMSFTVQAAERSINVYNWAEYISDGAEDTLDVNAEFERRTGIKVNYTNYATNEDLYAKLKSGGSNYDIVIPSDYMIERLIDEGYLQKINFDNIPNYKYISERYKDMYFDPKNEYSVPYTVGMVGLIYNKEYVAEDPTSWEVMWDGRYTNNILMFESSRDAFAIAQFILGQDLNTENPDDWYAAAEKLKEQKPVLQSYVSDEIYNKLEGESAYIGAYYAGDYLSMADNNPNLAFVYPEEGTNFFVDSMCIPTSSQNKELAEMYINFMLEPDIAKANAEYICYATPHTGVLSMDDYEYKDNEILYPDDETLANTQYFHNLSPKTLQLMTELWEEVKLDNTSNTSMYIGFAVLGAATLAAIIYRAIRKKIREI